ncbi:hypothetical protein [Acinetobacter baumannii]|uniref:hypothetical protein n=1 Tax=Acinetobacter baumannii TaxID=470 RepID=UPI00232FB458|nr:hypothetical protein [Acinetobacter baumannii]
MKKKILVIDDEIHGLRPEMYGELAEDFFLNLNDEYQDETKALLSFINSNSEYFKPVSIDELIQMSPKELFNNFFSHEYFMINAPKILLEPLSTIYSTHESLLKVKKVINEAFPLTEYSHSFYEILPSPIKNLNLSQFELIIIDLKIGKDDSKSFLQDISKEENLPPIILISSHFNTETGKLSDYFGETYISATGLTLLPKIELKAPDTGKIKLRLLADQLIAQREISNNTKNLIKTWEALLDSAKKEFSKMLWKLDATIMQQIYNDSNDDKVAFSDMINNFLAKELLWNIEESRNLENSVKLLEESFKKYTNKSLAYELDVNAHRMLLSHHFYVGGNSEEIDLLSKYCKYPSGKTKDKKRLVSYFTENLLSILPFGSILYNVKNNTILINITQQCNLTGISRSEKNSLNSLLFIKANISKKSNSKYIPYDDKTLVSILHRKKASNIVEFLDIEPNSKHLLSVSVGDFIDLLKKEPLKIIGRMRHEHVISLQQDTAVTILKPAQTRISRLGSCKYKITLIKKDNENLNFSDQKDFSEVTAIASDKYRLSDKLSIDLTIWLKSNIPELELTPKELLDQIIQANKISGKMNLKGIDIFFQNIDSPLPKCNTKKHTLVIGINTQG